MIEDSYDSIKCNTRIYFDAVAKTAQDVEAPMPQKIARLKWRKFRYTWRP